MQTGHDLEVAQQRLQDELADIEPGPQHHASGAVSADKSKTSIRGTRLSTISLIRFVADHRFGRITIRSNRVRR
jgi:hypothetical protein